jgi:hypothetical protein
VRPSHSAIADWMACRSASGIPADPLASASGQPWRLRWRCFGGAEDSERGRRAIISDNLARPDALQFFSTTCYVRPGFIGHCNVRSSLNLAGAFRTSKKRCLRFGQAAIAN